ncbi:MAG: exodeoxyribonuclease III [Pseudomonadota bacterium]
MRLATWNINGLRARLEFIALWLKDRKPDVVGFQELKTPTADFPHDFFTELGYHALVHGQKSWNGVAILTREPAELVTVGLPGEDDFGSRLITAQVGNEIEFTTVYCPNGKNVSHDDFPKKLKWYESLISHYSGSGDQRRILCGDFNIVPKPLDSWRGEDGDGEVFHTVEERQRFAGLMDVGLIDLYRYRYPEQGAFSWWDYRGGSFYRNQGLRIDFVLGTPAVSEMLKDVTIDRDYRKKKDGLTASDHAPVFADLEV